MGFGLSIISIFGIIALSGVVVNDSLVLIDASTGELVWHYQHAPGEAFVLDIVFDHHPRFAEEGRDRPAQRVRPRRQ